MSYSPKQELRLKEKGARRGQGGLSLAFTSKAALEAAGAVAPRILNSLTMDSLRRALLTASAGT